jgi:hypothetical protein
MRDYVPEPVWPAWLARPAQALAVIAVAGALAGSWATAGPGNGVLVAAKDAVQLPRVVVVHKRGTELAAVDATVQCAANTGSDPASLGANGVTLRQ